MKVTAIDLFAGAGGFSTGASLAGVKVLWAANHWPEAVRIHRKNHPRVAHSCQDLQQADWSQVPSHDIILASPACQGHSRARGKERDHHDVTRSTAWAVVACAEYHLPEAIIVENVREFLSWLLFPAWKQAMETLGYSLSINILNAADFGVPQSRERVFLVLTRSRKPLPPMPNPEMIQVPARDILNLDEGNWSLIRKPGRSQRTLDQIAQGRKIHGKQFLVAFYGAEKFGRSLDRPLGTVTTRDRFAIINGNKMRMLSVEETRRAMGFPEDYVLPDSHRLAMHMLGNAVCPPVAAAVIEYVVSHVA